MSKYFYSSFIVTIKQTIVESFQNLNESILNVIIHFVIIQQFNVCDLSAKTSCPLAPPFLSAALNGTFKSISVLHFEQYIAVFRSLRNI